MVILKKCENKGAYKTTEMTVRLFQSICSQTVTLKTDVYAIITTINIFLNSHFRNSHLKVCK